MKTLSSVLFCLVLVLNTRAQTRDEARLSETIAVFNKAMLDGNKAALAALTASELSYGHSNGRIESKDVFIDALGSGKADFISLNVTDQSIKVTGNTAVARHKLTASIVDNGTPANVNLGVMMIWQKMRGQWKLLARQACKL